MIKSIRLDYDMNCSYCEFFMENGQIFGKLFSGILTPEEIEKITKTDYDFTQ